MNHRKSFAVKLSPPLQTEVMEGGQVPRHILLIIICMICGTPGAFALENDFTFVDFLAVMVGLLIAFVGFCACLGAYARRRDAI